KFLQNANGPGIEWTNNGPQVSAAIKNAAGIQSQYQYLLSQKQINSTWPINHEQPVVIEIIAGKNKLLDKQQLNDLLLQNKVSPDALYQWENHYLIFGKAPDVFVLKERIRKAFPGTQVKEYDDLFYEFNRIHCDDKKVTKEWDHVLLTANLVTDPKLQKEYLDYHATQFEKWPEVAAGFCRADFQQLLLFRNGRQLILVISIPKGESLDKLNPKTTENNPRVDEWNLRMKKYQEGIPGTKPGEVWVFLKAIK
ncbi:MAG: L-rhamnose mutarotase, partial [Chitinophagaceae bacterium]